MTTRKIQISVDDVTMDGLKAAFGSAEAPVALVQKAIAAFLAPAPAAPATPAAPAPATPALVAENTKLILALKKHEGSNAQIREELVAAQTELSSVKAELAAAVGELAARKADASSAAGREAKAVDAAVAAAVAKRDEEWTISFNQMREALGLEF
jgi:hypothetical protein